MEELTRFCSPTFHPHATVWQLLAIFHRLQNNDASSAEFLPNGLTRPRDTIVRFLDPIHFVQVVHWNLTLLIRLEICHREEKDLLRFWTLNITWEKRDQRRALINLRFTCGVACTFRHSLQNEANYLRGFYEKKLQRLRARNDNDVKLSLLVGFHVIKIHLHSIHTL